MPSKIEIHKRFNAIPFPPKEREKLGIAIETIGKLPINGLRRNPENGTCGWYIWCGEEMSDDADFFKPLHVGHILEYLPEIEQYLSLPPGYRFLVAHEYEDVWQDLQLTTL
ncbi:immunity protein Imm33 domain-containing protein [Shewanella zhangzhouensis]|uniref:immunity protein Imm33 domain-containing protein n=1 Tax=Shewanella zhangzhouensis TaxID=2864213 RepID=UPI001C657C1B|nr:hypothetical protein [Shewanella zhangzhouensis]QYK05233.1 hypothetical protein K0H63_19680 [Shewanella zhangzhouensis]